MSALRRLRPALPWARRLFVVMVAAYVLASLTAGGTPAAWPTFYALAGSGCALLAAYRYVPRLPDRPALAWVGRTARVLEVVACNAALTLVLGEVALRGFWAWRGTSLVVSDTLDAHRLVPGHDYGGGLRGNRLGYPGREFEPERRPGVARVAALGDSFAVGPAVPFADNYLTRLEGALPGTEVYNFGVSGAGPREYLAVLRRDVWAYRPDLVLVSFFVGNDVTESLATPRHLDPRRHALYLLLTRGWRLARERWRPAPVAAAGPSGRPAGPPLSEETFREVEARRLEVCASPPPPGLEKKWRRALADLDRLIADCRRQGVPVAVVLIPDEFQVNPAVLADALNAATVRREDLDLEYPQRRLCAFCAGRGVPCLDLLPAFRGVPDTYAPRDTHWNVRGNRLAATELAAWLRPQLAR